MHGRIRITIDPRITTMPGWSTWGFHRPGTHCLHQAQIAVRYWAIRMKGKLHASKNHFRGGLAYGRQRLMDLFVFWCGHFQRQQ